LYIGVNRKDEILSPAFSSLMLWVNKCEVTHLLCHFINFQHVWTSYLVHTQSF
jgi:hypothetical protein